ncbi:MAG: hypothetical protein LLG04_17735 [Parachlamydia sp.]|nr:hypothetical protein [Parachlamydia sp.]
MKKLFLSLYLLCAIATLPAQAFNFLPLSLDRSQLKEIKCDPVQIPTTQPQLKPIQSKTTFTDIKAVLSTNWSGYVAVTDFTDPKTHSVSMVSGAWIVPRLTATTGDSSSAIWVGIDGFADNSPTVEQIGTQQIFAGGSASYFAFFEVFPGAAFQLVDFPIRPGDLVGGEVAYVKHDKFFLYIMNFTVGVFTVVPVKVKGAKRNSAEWIVEAPTVSDTLQSLSNFGSVPFVQCTAKINGDVGSISDDDWENAAIIMVSQSNDRKTVPTTLKKDGESFVVVWKSEGP